MLNSSMDFIHPKSNYSNNLVSSMKMNLVKGPNMKAIICEDRCETWAQMWERTNRLSNGMYGLGMKKGDRVAALLTNCFEFPETFVTTTKSGFVLSPVNFHLKAAEVAYQLNDCGASAVVANSEFINLLMSIKDQIPTLKHIIVTEDRSSTGIISYEQLIAESAPEELDVEISPNDLHMILYTSGTTGRPKGAVRGYSEDYHTGITVCVEWKIRNGDIQLAVAPLYHAGPCAWYCATLVSGGTLVVVPAFHPNKVLEAVEKHKVNWMMMVPIMYDRMLSLPDDVLGKYDISFLRSIISGGAPLHTSTKLKIKKHFANIELNEFYGSTELGVSTTLRDEDQLKKERSVGRPLQDLEIKLVGQNGSEVPTGEVGLLYSRGLGGFRGYWNNDQATNEAFLEREWATVGDLARQDEDGYYYIVDRAKDMIITGGVNVYPVEVEEVLYTMSEIMDVAVIGVPDEKWGESVKAIIVPKPGANITEEQIIDFCKDQMAGFKVPKSVDFVEVIPRLQTGKILKRELRKKFWKNDSIQVA